MPRKTKPMIAEAPEEVRARGGLFVLSDFEQAYIVETVDAKGKVKAEKHAISGRAGDEFVMPEGWQRDASFEELVYTKSKPRNGMAFILPNTKRVVLPVQEA